MNVYLLEMDFKEILLERAIWYNGDWQIIFTTPAFQKWILKKVAWNERYGAMVIGK